MAFFAGATNPWIFGGNFVKENMSTSIDIGDLKETTFINVGNNNSQNYSSCKCASISLALHLNLFLKFIKMT